MTSIARAIDLGYGNVKYTCMEKGEVQCRLFPSVAVPALSKDFDSRNLPTARMETLVVEVNQRIYHVGPDSQSLAMDTAGRELDPEYARREQYTALMKGALAYMNEPVIDYLVLGLPVSTFAKENGRLVAVWTGRHEVPSRTHSGQRRFVDVRRVIAVPQPIGTYMRAWEVGLIREGNGNILVVDPGYFTLDWVVLTPKSAIVHTKSGALEGGMQALVLTLQTALERATGNSIQDTAEIERAWRHGTPATLFTRQFSLQPYMDQVEARVEGMVAEVARRLGDRSSIGQVIVAGGGAKVFEKALRTKFGTAAVLDQPEFANLRGFQIVGESLARRAPAGAHAAA